MRPSVLVMELVVTMDVVEEGAICNTVTQVTPKIGALGVVMTRDTVTSP